MEPPKLAATTITYKSTSNVYEAQKLLASLPQVIACDFETASKWTDEQKAAFKETLETLDPTTEEARILQQAIESDGLSHPSLSQLTHFSVAGSPTEGIVLILDNSAIEKYLMSWLVRTNRKQIWHNASFDFKLIYYRTGKVPKNYEDTQQWAKVFINHVNVYSAKTGLKHLMGHKYGRWAVAKDNFNVSHMYDEEVLLYAATDACATLALYNDLVVHTKKPVPQENLL